MTDEDGNVIFENCNFSKLPFFDPHKVNLMELLDSKKLLITNPLKNYFIQLPHDDNNTPRSLEDILEFYKMRFKKVISIIRLKFTVRLTNLTIYLMIISL